MKEYEYVTKKEYSPVRKEIEEKIISKVHKILKKDYGITFQQKLNKMEQNVMQQLQM